MIFVRGRRFLFHLLMIGMEYRKRNGTCRDEGVVMRETMRGRSKMEEGRDRSFLSLLRRAFSLCLLRRVRETMRLRMRLRAFCHENDSLWRGERYRYPLCPVEAIDKSPVFKCKCL